MLEKDFVSVRFEGDIAWVTICNPPVNATSAAVRAGLLNAVKTVQSARAAVLACDGRTFVAGGDMSEFDAPPEAPDLPDVVQAIEDSPVPFIAALHGNVLGGGLELALGCAWRIASRGTKFGLPEVNVGLIPGAGGTQRLPRLVGLPLATDMAASGKIVDTDTFSSAGGLDLVVEDALEAAVLAFAANLPALPDSISARTVAALTPADMEKTRAAVAKSAKGQNSPLLNLEALTWSVLPFEQGQPKERALHLELRESMQSQALRHAFFAERAVSKPAAISAGQARELNRIVVVGGGLMGAGIATSALSVGASVTIIERDGSAADAAQDRVYGNLDRALKLGKISAETCRRQKDKLSVAAQYDAAAGHDLAIEAVFEDVAIKKDVFARLEAVMATDAILATNTSYLDPKEIFADVSDQTRCVGLHFFSPAHIMKLLEVVQLPSTTADTLATAFTLAKRLKKIAVLSGICDGFIGNRMLSEYRRAAEYMLADGALPQEIDDAMRAFGMAMGPFAAQDMGGLQIAHANRRHQDATRDPAERYVAISDQLCDLGRLGQRAGKGWFQYENGNRTPQADPAVTALIEAYSSAQNITRNPIEQSDIQVQLLAVLANEGALIVEEGIAQDDAAVDMVKIHGYGFPRWRGGPMKAATAMGYDAIRAALDALDTASPDAFKRATRFAS